MLGVNSKRTEITGKNSDEVRKQIKENNMKIIASGLVAAMSGFLLQGMFDNVWYNYRVFLLFWIYIAIGAVVDIVSRRTKV